MSMAAAVLQAAAVRAELATARWRPVREGTR